MNLLVLRSPLLLLPSLQPQLSESAKENPRDPSFVIQMPFIIQTAPTTAFFQARAKLEGVDARVGAYSFSLQMVKPQSTQAKPHASFQPPCLGRIPNHPPVEPCWTFMLSHSAKPSLIVQPSWQHIFHFPCMQCNLGISG